MADPIQQPAEPATPASAKKRVAVVGAGLSGLTTAKYLIDQGYLVTVIDAKPQVGGKILTRQIGDKPTDLADRGAEYIDSNQQRLLALCDELHVSYIQANDTMASRYYLPNGKVIPDEEFNQAYRAISEQIYRDSLILKADPAGRMAQYLDQLSTAQYLDQLAANIPDNRSWLEKLPLIGKSKPGVDPNILRMAAQGFAAERMRPASQISALQFVHETASQTGDLIPSDCKYRIQGGTQRLTDALEAHLKEKGAQFELGSKVTQIEKTGSGFSLGLDQKPGPQQFDQVVLATQANPIANIQGIDQFLPADDIETLRSMQYTGGTKITIGRLAPVTNNGFFVSQLGYEAWNRAPGETVLMIGDDLSARYKPRELMNLVLADYARAHGTTPDQLFNPNMVYYGGPDMNNPCYGAPAPGQYLKLRKLAQSIDRLAGEGLGIAGTYLPGEMQMPDRTESANRMGHGVESAFRTASILNEVARPEERASVPERVAPSFVTRVTASRQAQESALQV